MEPEENDQLVRFVWKKSGINSPVEGKVVYPMIYRVLAPSKRWLCGISEVSTVPHLPDLSDLLIFFIPFFAVP